jgi:hypothetical protein
MSRPAILVVSNRYSSPARGPGDLLPGVSDRGLCLRSRGGPHMSGARAQGYRVSASPKMKLVTSSKSIVRVAFDVVVLRFVSVGMAMSISSAVRITARLRG